LLVGAGGAYWLSGGRVARQRAAEDAPEQVAERWRGFAAGTPGVAEPAAAAAAQADGASPESAWVAPQITRDQLGLAIQAWRQAIIDKSPDDVLTLDRVFSMLPGRYGPELEKLAQDDPDERVRAFSTRVLGKLKNVELAGILQRLLADKSPFVRQNAAWAFGELVALPKGREAAEGAIAELRHLEESDPAEDVRAEATKTLKKLQ
jgi:hypothetical protein